MKDFSHLWKSRRSVANSREKRMVVVVDDSAQRKRMLVILLLLLAGIGIGGFYLGLSMAARDLTILRSELSTTKTDYGEASEELDTLRRRLAILERGAWISREAAEEVRLELVRMREEKSALNRDISFYRGIMDPAKVEHGVTVQNFELVPTSNPRRFQWRMVIVQNARQHQFLKGNIKVQVEGHLNDKKQVYDLSRLSTQFSKGGESLGFRYFQGFPGDGGWGVIEIPGVFDPETAEVSIQLTTPS